MNECTQNESMAQNNRYKFTKLSNDLAETLDFLTNEARKYAVTGIYPIYIITGMR